MSTSKRTRRSSEVCTLDDGRRVRFSSKKRAGRPWLFVCFDGPGGEQKELSTREKNRKPARIIEPEEQRALFDWLDARWGWRLPILLLEVKAAIGCRIGELCSARTDALKDGRLTFVAETTKGRQERSCLLPADLFEELVAIAFGCNPSTMRQHYLQLDKVAVADDVFSRIQQGDIKGARGHGTTGAQKNGTRENGHKSLTQKALRSAGKRI